MAKRIVIDLEMCNVQKVYRSKRYPYATEIIQIGAVTLDETDQIVNMFSSYVKPEYGAIDNFIRNLTGICEKDVKGAPPLGEATRNMMDWIGTGAVNFYTWGDTDFHQLKKELYAKGLVTAVTSPLTDLNNWVDYQQVFETRFKFGRVLSLKDALFYAELDPEGRLHDGLADAYNTARIIAAMEHNPEKMFLIDRVRHYEQEKTDFGTSLGSLLHEFNLQTA